MTNQPLKLWLFFMQNGRCVLCGEPLRMDVGRFAYGGLSIEHKLPRAHGGTDSRFNLAASHRECNQLRKDGLSTKCVRPAEHETPAYFGRKPLVVAPNVWWSHFRMPLDSTRWRKLA